MRNGSLQEHQELPLPHNQYLWWGCDHVPQHKSILAMDIIEWFHVALLQERKAGYKGSVWPHPVCQDPHLSP